MKIALATVCVGVGGYLLQIVLQSTFRPYAVDRIYFQEWSSEDMMQTASLQDLRAEPFVSLWNLHVQPPGLDAIRAALTRLWPAIDPPTAVRHVDRLLYHLWSLCYGILGSLGFLWMLKLVDAKAAAVTAVVILLHPAAIFYATFLDGTMLSAVLILWMYYLLWKAKAAGNVHVLAFPLVVLALFFTRSLFQWPFLVVLAISLWMIGLPRRKVLTFVAVTTLVVGLYMVKQRQQFGIAASSSLAGFSLLRSVGLEERLRDFWELPAPASAESHSSMPSVLTRERKLGGQTNFNHFAYLERNRDLLAQYEQYMRAAPIQELARSYWLNLRIYFQPSSLYTAHAIVDRLPWRPYYDSIFSAPVLPVLLLLAGVSSLAVATSWRELAASIGFALPAAYVFLASVLFERGENMRFKFLLEPVLCVFLLAQIYAAWLRARPALLGRISPTPSI